jgi:hypothetical protein
MLDAFPPFADWTTTRGHQNAGSPHSLDRLVNDLGREPSSRTEPDADSVPSTRFTRMATACHSGVEALTPRGHSLLCLVFLMISPQVSALRRQWAWVFLTCG